MVQAEEQAEVTKLLNLTPIPRQIQERLKEKMSALGRERNISPGQTVDTNKLKLEDILTRSTFIRMTSSQDNPVILMGGELLADGTASDADYGFSLGKRGEFSKMAAGYEDIYGPRLYIDQDDFYAFFFNEVAGSDLAGQKK